MASKVTAAEVNAFYAQQFEGRSGQDQIVEVRENYARLRHDVTQQHLRPGNYISGPTQMALADSAAYVAIFTRTGIVPMAVTSNLNINFLRPCIGTAVVGEARLMKLGKALAVIEVEIRAEGSDKMSSHAIVTYALPREA
ncbi:MAG: PaaI family thioesterase [Alphaproteobacteria bacterium]|nr:PaaI family thioesterase [Alphaproteobacteria bacterium]